MSSERPAVVRADERRVAAGPATPGMVREVAFSGDDRWVGHVRTDAGVAGGWHHHGTTESYFYVLRGTIEVEFGPGGEERITAGAGDFVHVPPGVVHREITTGDEPGELILVRFGPGAPVTHVDGPDPA